MSYLQVEKLNKDVYSMLTHPVVHTIWFVEQLNHVIRSIKDDIPNCITSGLHVVSVKPLLDQEMSQSPPLTYVVCNYIYMYMMYVYLNSKWTYYYAYCIWNTCQYVSALKTKMNFRVKQKMPKLAKKYYMYM